MDTTAAAPAVNTPQPMGWDANGTPITAAAPSSQPMGWDANGTPITAMPSSQPQPVTPAAPSLTDNPNGEGIYRMKGPDGRELGIPYSKAKGLGKPQGFQFADDQEYSRFMKDYLADPHEAERTNQLAQQDPSLNILLGAGRGALKTLLGANDLMEGTPEEREKMNKKLPQLPGVVASDSAARERQSPIRQFADEPNTSGWQTLGETGENVAEFSLGEGLLKMVPELAGAQKMGTVTKLLQIAEKHPLIAQALQQGMVAAGQTFTKTGGDVAASLESGALTAGASGTVGALAKGAGSAIARRATTVEDVGGVPTEIPASVRNAAKPTPQQTAGQQSLRNTAQDVTRMHLEEANESRAVPPSPKGLPSRTGPFEFNLRGVTPTETTTGTITPRAAELPRSNTSVPATRTPETTEYSRVGAEPEYIRPGGGDAIAERQGRVWAERRIPGHMHSAAPGELPADSTLGGGGNLTTQDANIAKAHIQNLNEVIDSPHFEQMDPAQQQDLLSARSEAQKQMADYHEHVMQNLPGNVKPKPNLEPLDVPTLVRKVGSWADVPKTIEKTATDGFEMLNDVTGDRFNALREANKQAWDAYKGASGADAQRVARANLEKTEADMADLFKGLRGIVGPKELDGFNDSYRNAQGLHRVADAIESTFSGNSSASARSWEYRGFDGNALMSNMNKVEQSLGGRGALNRLIGEENANTLYRVAELNRTQAQRTRFGSALTEVAKNLGPLLGHVSLGGIGATYGWRTTHTPEGAALGFAAGAGVGQATKIVANAVLTNPKLAKQLIYAMDYGDPKNYGPFLASVIQKQVTDSANEKRALQQEGTNR